MSEISAITRLREQRVGLIEQMRATINVADAESRDMTADELGKVDQIEQDIALLDKQIEVREAAAGHQAQLVESRAAQVVQETAAIERPSQPMEERSEYRDAFLDYIRSGERRDMLLSPNTSGGYTVPVTLMNQLYEYRRQFGVIRPLATVMQTGTGETMNLPTLTAYGSSSWMTEGAAYSESDHTFGQVSFGAYKAGHLVQISEELLQDSQFDLESLIARTFGESMARLEQTSFVTGTGSGQPTGILAASGGASTGKTTAGATAITFDEILDLIHSVSPQYRTPGSAFVMKDSTVAYLRKVKTGVASDNRYIWQESATAGTPPALFGYAVYIDPDFPAIATAAKTVAFGDWSRYYIRDAGSMQLQRLNERYADNGLVGFRLWHRLDAKLIDTNAIKLLVQA